MIQVLQQCPSRRFKIIQGTKEINGGTTIWWYGSDYTLKMNPDSVADKKESDIYAREISPQKHFEEISH